MVEKGDWKNPNKSNDFIVLLIEPTKEKKAYKNYD